ncbi:MAG TPA: TaqI-like C-terminal specificity domain-containing protein [Chitinophagales bacterium]|nr:TaqI-like C-terminal specificity domain-containing protein [Chitinophagales bacterium]HNK90711.1 TaqI-like C-terminal specificity domain-containing protein [Chitinophagales bacterium]
MKLVTQSPKKALKAFLKQRPSESERDKFKNNLIALLDKISVIEKQPKDESEEHLKNNLRDFLRDTYYIDSNAINTKDKKDLVIHIGKSTDTDVAVIIEAKRPSNKNEMVSADNANKKALHELILYYLTERNAKENVQLKQLVVTDINQWFIIDANYFDKHIYRNTQIRKLYETKVSDKKDNPWFYEEIAKIVSKIEIEIPCIYFDIRDYEKILRNTKTDDDKELVALYKILSPQHLLKIVTPNDSNTLNEKFYKELLHIIGLEEAKEGAKNIIRRKKENRNPASLIELTIEALKTEDTFHRILDIKVYGDNKEEQTFNIALELCITWINRILFLKLLEGQLISYHQGNKDFRFLNSETIHDFDELFKLFHKVLAVNIPDRTEAIKAKYSRVPYLNSSLFEISELEDQTIKINSLENDGQLELINTTILKEIKKKAASLPSLDYLFHFLDAYDFASEGTEDWQKDNKLLINASVLGKVFEKINGYRDGSIFTPAFITMYMCRQSIRLAVVEKFNEVLADKGKRLFDKFDDIKNYTSRHFKTDEVLKANEIINSLHICDPAVGSGHFLVSALNEIIAIKAELGILADEKGNNLSGYEIEIINDELIITDQQGNPVEYKLQNGKPINKEVQRLQKTLFHQKQTIIENCLFGVDINSKSVLICRLRLWIELLKNAYYKETEYTELETLPNIDINIKCGNSLLSRFAIDADLSKALKSIKYDIKAYRGFVNDYKNEKNRDVKRGLQKIIDGIKADFKTYVGRESKEQKKLDKLSEELFNKYFSNKLFSSNLSAAQKKDRKSLEEQVAAQKKIIDDINNSVIYKNAFEWRFEFPEVLNNKGEFGGFDLIIGNPPYGVSLKDGLREAIVNKLSKVPDYEIYYFFINLSKFLLKPNGIKSYIIPNTILFNVFAKNYRENLFQNWQIQEILDCTDFNVFEGSATVRCIITQFINKKSDDIVYYRPTANVTSFDELKERKLNETTKAILLENNQNWALVFKLSSDVLQLISKIKSNKKSLEKHFPEFSQGLIAYDKYQGQDEHTIKNRIFHSTTKQTGWKKWLWGEDITPYSVKWNGKEYINYCDGIANPREPKYFKGERILVREITNPKIFVGYTEDEGYNDPAIINIIKNKKGDFELKTLLAILNSKLATFYHFNSSPKATKGAFPKILVEDIKTFPLPNVSSSQQLNIIKLVDKIISLKEQGKDSSKQENEIDELVYKLYNITNDEIRIIENG